MLTISLDEEGKFDTGRKSNKSDSKTTMIGGILFDDCDKEGELENERKRIEAYCRSVINDVMTKNRGIFASFPGSLHSNGNNGNVVRLVKMKLSETLPDFIKHGTYANKCLKYDNVEISPREGRYSICAVVKSTNGKQALLRSELGDFFRDGVASNLYFHMASEAVEHFVFHNPIYPQGGNFKLDIATRISSEIDDNMLEPYIMQGLNPAKTKGNQFFLTNADVFRTILTEQMMGDKKKDIQISSFMVNSIKYDPSRVEGKDSNDEWYKEYIFLYLADIVCAFLTHDTKKDDVKEIYSRAETLTGGNNLVFAYDEIDEYFKRSWRDVEAGEYCRALSELYYINNNKSCEAELYKENWIPFIEETVISKISEEKLMNDMRSVFFNEVQKLRNSYMTNSLNAEEAFYVFKIFEKAAGMVKEENKSDRLQYYLNDIGVKAYCHRGDTASVAPYFKECERNACAVDMEEYIRTRNQYATALCDSFDYEKAVRITNETVSIAKGIYDLSIKLRGNTVEDHFGKTEFAKTLSLAGQFASFMCDDESALSLFDNSFRFMKNDRINTKITESYKLHLLIQMNDKDKYMETLADYCDGASSVKGQLGMIGKMVKSGEVSEKYALYVFLKGLYYLYETDTVGEVWDRIKDLIKDIPDTRKNDHPWELIYKYFGLLSVKMGESGSVKECISMIDKVSDTKKDTLIYTISLESKAQLFRTIGDEEKADQLYKETHEILKGTYKLFDDEADTKEDIEQRVKDKLSYMYQ